LTIYPKIIIVYSYYFNDQILNKMDNAADVMDNPASKNSRFNSSLIAGQSIYSKNDHKPTYRPKGLQNWVINMTIAGKGLINTKSDQFEVGVGDILLFPSGVTHDYTHAGNGKWKHLWIYFTPQPRWVHLMKWPERSNKVLGISIFNNGKPNKYMQNIIKKAFNQTIRIYDRTHSKRLEFCQVILEEIFYWCHEFNHTEQRPLGDPRIDEAIEYLIQNLHKPININIMANKVKLSASRFAHLFKDITQQTPVKYLEGLRIWKAQQLLISTSSSIAQIAYETGFSDALYFSRVFTNNCGLSPRKWRDSM
jgi:AraC family transcriptional regulator, arabinose operon regulatory protein